MLKKEYLGTALKFPVVLTAGGSPAIVEDVELLAQSAIEYLKTAVGTKFFLAECGSRLRDFCFEPNDDYLQDMIEYWTRDCLKTWEPRLAIVGVVFERGDDVLQMDIDAIDSQSGIPFSFVFPFYTNLKY